MPPSSSSSSLSSSDLSVRILSNLPKEYVSEIPRELHSIILSKTRELIRTLKSKSSGQSMCRGDSLEARHAAVLGFVLRRGIRIPTNTHGHQSMFSINIPLQVLGKCVGQRKADVERVSNAMTQMFLTSNHSLEAIGIGGTSAAAVTSSSSRRTTRGTRMMQKMMTQSKTTSHTTTSTTRSKSKSVQIAAKKTHIVKHTRPRSGVQSTSNKSSVSVPTRTRSTVQVQEVKPMYLHDISMKLQSKLHDPEACEKSASILFHQLFKYKHDNARTMQMKRIVADDFSRNSKLYDGCCFFIAAKEIEFGSYSLMYKTIPAQSNNKHNQSRRTSSASTSISMSALKSKLINLYMYTTQKENGMMVVAKGDNISSDSSLLHIEDVANVLHLEINQMIEFLGDILYGVREMRIDHISRKVLHVPPGEKEGYHNKDGEISNVAVGGGVGVEIIHTPHNCNAEYRDKAKFDQWRNDLLERLTNSDENRDAAIDKLFSSIISPKQH